MRTHKLPRLAQGQPVSVALLNRIIDHVNGLEINVSGSLEQVTLPGGTRIIRGIPAAAVLKIGVLEATLTRRASADCKVFKSGGGSETESAELLRVHDWLLAVDDDPLAVATHVVIGLIDNTWYVIAAACAPEGELQSMQASMYSSSSFQSQSESTIFGVVTLDDILVSAAASSFGGGAELLD